MGVFQMTKKEALSERLEQAYRTSRFHSFAASINGVSDVQTAWKPPSYRGYPHMDGSILNLAYHCAGDKHVLMSTCFGDGSIGWPEVNQMFIDYGADLTAAARLADEGHVLVLATLDSWPDERFGEPRPYYSGKQIPAEEIFSIVAEHDLYHAGQIWMVRNMIAGL